MKSLVELIAQYIDDHMHEASPGSDWLHHCSHDCRGSQRRWQDATIKESSMTLASGSGQLRDDIPGRQIIEYCDRL